MKKAKRGSGEGEERRKGGGEEGGEEQGGEIYLLKIEIPEHLYADSKTPEENTGCQKGRKHTNT